ncbi:calcium-binding tyrosine phosphorylation-regulated protein isoform X1 [Thamnophis elegans]|uniref:calcium-binding tyrosine phosphorylation-regulated protein isoform X1 n=1 Tax=Thamnophis elegans TaxID=35005 RepID=UPI001377D1AB|nr:calcium-binding tyrosine phosphorylation-regulated protein isoform X1 [Thamnophis elegans]
MHTAKPRMVVPYGLKTLLEGVSRAVLKASPSNITEFAAEYFKELIVFREEHPNLDIKELVREFHMTRVEGWAEGPGAATPMPRSKRADVGDAFRSDLDTIPIHDEPKRKEKSTDTEEDQISEESRELSTKTTQFPSVVDEFVEKVGDDKGAGLAYIPADPAQLASQMLGNVETMGAEPELKDVAISVQTLPTLSHTASEAMAAIAVGQLAAPEPAPAPAPEPAPELAPEPAPAEAEPAEEEAPAPAEAEPAEAEPAVAAAELAEAAAEPAEVEAEPAEAETEPAEAETEPAEAETEPAEAETEPAEAETEPAEAETEPAEAETEPAPAEAEPAPEEAELAPEEAEPAPEEAEPAPTEAEPAPEEGDAAPEEAEIRTSATSLRAGSVTQSQSSVQEEIAISGSLAEQSPADLVEQASSDPLQEGEPPPPLPPPPPDKDLFQAEGCPSEIELTSDIHIINVGDDDPSAGGEPVPPPYVEQFPQQIVIPFVDTVACLLDPLTASLNSGQFTSILDPSADDAECDPDRMDTTEQLKSTDPGFIMSVAIPLEDVMNGKNGSGAGDKAAFAGSYGIAGEITFTTASVRRTE